MRKFFIYLILLILLITPIVSIVVVAIINNQPDIQNEIHFQFDSYESALAHVVLGDIREVFVVQGEYVGEESFTTEVSIKQNDVIVFSKEVGDTFRANENILFVNGEGFFLAEDGILKNYEVTSNKLTLLISRPAVNAIKISLKSKYVGSLDSAYISFLVNNEVVVLDDYSVFQIAEDGLVNVFYRLPEELDYNPILHSMVEVTMYSGNYVRGTYLVYPQCLYLAEDKTYYIQSVNSEGVEKIPVVVGISDGDYVAIDSTSDNMLVEGMEIMVNDKVVYNTSISDDNKEDK